ncbi:MAG: tetratricopeptide repeat protein [Myxococcales bacterium]|nr:tetratricopeptide repeat protein [Myxococcales bacterium]MCB9522260.1 tetratricopeptide repeat protein [Myxococcales bacterium]
MALDHSDIVLEELARLREEVVNTRNVSIKTDNLIKNVAAEVKAITERQAQTERKSLINSGFAYIIFVALISVGLYLTFQARTEKHQVNRALYEKKEAGFKRQIAELNAELGRWKQIERELLEFERLVRDGNKELAVAKFSTLRRVRFSGLLEDLIVRFKAEVATEMFQKGRDLYEKGTFDKADEAFLKSLEYDDKAEHIASLMFYQGMSALRLKDFPRAAELLRKALESDKPLGKDQTSAARYHMAYAHDRMGEKRTAANLYFRFFNRHTKHTLSTRAKRRYKQLKSK